LNKYNKIGQLRHRAYLRTLTTSKDANGAEVETWANGAEFWCNIEYQISGVGEDQVGRRVQPFTKAIVHLRYDGTITEKMQIVLDNKEYNIETLAPDAHRMYMQIVCVRDDEG
jgi:SPP1 family predicted phage head-tail adaptor